MIIIILSLVTVSLSLINRGVKATTNKNILQHVKGLFKKKKIVMTIIPDDSGLGLINVSK